MGATLAKGNLHERVRFFYQVLLFVDAFIKVMGEDSHSDCLGI